MNKKEDLFTNIDQRTIEDIADNFPVLSEEEKERIFAMSERKYNNQINEERHEEQVSGVEVYRRPHWYKAVGIAAAAVLAVTGIGGSFYFISRNGSPNNKSANDEVETVTETSTDAEEVTTEEENTTEEATYSTDNTDPDALLASAYELTAGYADVYRMLQWYGLSVDESQSITFNPHLSYSESFDEWEISETYYKVTDERFKSIDDIKNFARKYLTDSVLGLTESGESDFPRTGFGSSFTSYFDYGNYSLCPTGERFELDQITDPSGEPVSFGFSDYIEYNGELYSKIPHQQPDEKFFGSEAEIVDSGDGWFTVQRLVTEHYCAFPTSDTGAPVWFRIVDDGGTWKIDSVDVGSPVEYDAYVMMQCYYDFLRNFSSAENSDTSDMIEVDGVSYAKYASSYTLGDALSGYAMEEISDPLEGIKEYTKLYFTDEAIDQFMPDLIGGKFITQDGTLYIRQDEGDPIFVSGEEPVFKWDMADIQENTEILSVSDDEISVRTVYYYADGTPFHTVSATIEKTENSYNLFTSFIIE